MKEKLDHLQYWNSLIIILYPREVPVEQFWNSYYVKLKLLLRFQQIIRKKIEKEEEEKRIYKIASA